MDGATGTLLRKKHVALLSTIIWLFLLEILERKRKKTQSVSLLFIFLGLIISFHCIVELKSAAQLSASARRVPTAHLIPVMLVCQLWRWSRVVSVCSFFPCSIVSFSRYTIKSDIANINSNNQPFKSPETKYVEFARYFCFSAFINSKRRQC